MNDWLGPVTIAPFTWTEAGTIGLLLALALLLGKVVAGTILDDITPIERAGRVVVVGTGLLAVWWIILPALFVMMGR